MANEQAFLYKYRAFTNGNEDQLSKIFSDNQIYFPSKNQFNDPFDCKFDYDFECGKIELKRYFRENLTRRNPEWNRKQREAWISEKVDRAKINAAEFQNGLKSRTEQMLSEIGIFSMSRVPNDILMWSHYADSHKGFCLKFYDDDRDSFISGAQQIVYSEKYPIVNPILDDDMIRLQKTLLTKALHWRYEQEWRIIDHEGGPGIKQFPPHLLTGVVFGCRMSEGHKKLIRDWCHNRKPAVTFYQACEAPHTYSLNIVPA